MMCAFIANTIPKNRSHAISMREKMLATIAVTEKDKKKTKKVSLRFQWTISANFVIKKI